MVVPETPPFNNGLRFGEVTATSTCSGRAVCSDWAEDGHSTFAWISVIRLCGARPGCKDVGIRNLVLSEGAAENKLRDGVVLKT